MSDGDVFLDEDGNEWLTSAGVGITDDGSGNCCRRQARKCSDNSLSGLWLPVSSIGSDPYYVKRSSDSLCYYFQGSDAADPCPGHTDIGTVTSQTDCSACDLTCYTKWTTSFSCLNSTWSAWVNAGNFCLDGTTNTARTHVSACDYQQYVQATGPVSCTTNSDCTGHSATAPALPTDTPGCLIPGCESCGCTHVPAFNATVTIAGTTSCTACFAAADNSGSASVDGNVDGTYTLERLPGGTCVWQKSFQSPNAFVALHRDCFSNNCANVGGGLDSPDDHITVKLARSAANTWKITVTNSNGATFFFDSGNFTYSDSDACTGVPSAAQANTTAGCVLPTGCTPNSAAHGGTGMASF